MDRLGDDRQANFLEALEDGIKNPHHVFTPEELNKCRNSGECCQCGLCCIAFTHYIPERMPTTVDRYIPTVRKQCLQVCPYLKDDGTGRFGCGCNDEKDRLELEVCRTWRGNDTKRPFTIKPFGFQRNFDIMQGVYIDKLIECGKPVDIAIAENLARRGILSNLRTPNLGNKWDKEVAGFVNRILSPEWPLETLPTNLFKLIKLEEWIKTCAEDYGVHGMIGLLNLGDETNPRVQEFRRIYISPFFRFA